MRAVLSGSVARSSRHVELNTNFEGAHFETRIEEETPTSTSVACVALTTSL